MTEKPVSGMSFEEALAALEGVVGRLEQDDVALEESIDLYERGARLKAHCAQKLSEAEARVEVIRAEEGKAVATEPLPEREAAKGAPRKARAASRAGKDEKSETDDDIPF